MSKKPISPLCYVSIWLGNPKTTEDSHADKLHIYKAIKLCETDPRPDAIEDVERIAAETLLQELPCSEAFLSDALAAAFTNDVLHVTTVVAVYLLEKRAFTLPITSLAFLGTFELRDCYAPNLTVGEYWRSIHGLIEAEKWDYIPSQIKSGVSIDQLDSEKEPPIYRYTKLGDSRKVEKLLQLGANVEAANEVGHTPLMVAATTENPQLTKLLLKAGASVSASTPENGYTALHWVVRHKPLNAESVCAVIRLLAKHGADVNKTAIEETTPVMYAAHFGSVEAVSALLDLGANPLLEDLRERSAIDIAKSKGFSQVVKLLSGKEQNPKSRLGIFKRLFSK